MTRQLHIKVPKRAAKNEIVQLRCKLNHPMESGWRQTQQGAAVARSLAGKFQCRFNGQEVFRAELDSGTASDPYLSFYVRVPGSGEFEFVWETEAGERFAERAEIKTV